MPGSQCRRREAAISERLNKKNMNRSEIREQVFKLLFRVEFNSMKDMAEQEDLFIAGNEPKLSADDGAEVREKYESIASKLHEIDAMINEETLGWDTGRMAKVDLTIIRLAIYEIKFDDQVPTGVAINEAVELAKKFGQDGSAAFVNGVLAKFA